MAALGKMGGCISKLACRIYNSNMLWNGIGPVLQVKQRNRFLQPVSRNLRSRLLKVQIHKITNRRIPVSIGGGGLLTTGTTRGEGAIKGKSSEGPSLGTYIGENGNAEGPKSTTLDEPGDSAGGQVGDKEGLLLCWCDVLEWPVRHSTWHSNPATVINMTRSI